MLGRDRRVRNSQEGQLTVAVSMAPGPTDRGIAVQTPDAFKTGYSNSSTVLRDTR